MEVENWRMKNSKEENKCGFCNRPGATKKKYGFLWHKECLKEAKKMARRQKSWGVRG